MISRYDVWLDGVALSSIDQRIYVSNIAYQATSVSHETNRIAWRDGQYSGARRIDTTKITVSFAVRAYNTAERQRIVQNIISWASNGVSLQASDRLGQFIRVKATRLPAVVSVMGWTDTLTVEFTAFDFPYWQDETPVTVEVENGGTGELFNPGVWETDVEAVITAAEAITSAEITCGETEFEFSGLSIPAGGTIRIAYTADHHILEIKDGGGTSLLDKRAASSSDDLRAKVGGNTVTFTADGSASCVFSVKGVYL